MRGTRVFFAKISRAVIALVPALIAGATALPAAAQVRFAVTLPATVKGPVTGRLIVITARKDTPEPRLAIGMNGPPVFGMDVEGLKPGETRVVDARADGFPFDMSKLPAGDYSVQAVLIAYTQTKRSDGHTIWVPVTQERVIAFMNPGNPYSKVAKVALDPAATAPVALTLSETIGPMDKEVDTPWIKRVTIKSKILSDFWGVPMTIGAEVLIPKGFQDNPKARYPAIYTFGHFGGPFTFDDDPKSDTEGERRNAADANVKTGYQFSQEWKSEKFPRMVGISLVSPGPYFIESYALNSANNGPWGDAITKELMPYLEKTFHLIDQPYGRIVEGASTGGWEALAMQLHYPDLFGGAWVFNPDPIDFTRYQQTDIYKEDNMFTLRLSEWIANEKLFRRSREGFPLFTMRDLSALEGALGSKGRSFYQLDIWQATHGPVGADGYPVLLFDKKTGVINKDVVKYMREKGYDLSGYMRDNWATLGPKLSGKLNFFAGEMDDFSLNLGVYKVEEMIGEIGGKDYPIRFLYGRPKKGHNWHHTDWAGVVREIATHVTKTAPTGAPLADWTY
ncbi:hypothetical protein ACVWZA_000890 [Sphingomonas sp. UYAg733]